jgi:hypothetical protein
MRYPGMDGLTKGSRMLQHGFCLSRWLREHNKGRFGAWFGENQFERSTGGNRTDIPSGGRQTSWWQMGHGAQVSGITGRPRAAEPPPDLRHLDPLSRGLVEAYGNVKKPR